MERLDEIMKHLQEISAEGRENGEAHATVLLPLVAQFKGRLPAEMIQEAGLQLARLTDESLRLMADAGLTEAELQVYRAAQREGAHSALTAILKTYRASPPMNVRDR